MKHSAYSKFSKICNYLQSPLLLAIRLLLGWQFFMAGIGKLSNLTATVGAFSSMELPVPMFLAPFVALVETIGGIFLFFGLFSRVTAIFLSAIMIGALSTAHFDAVKVFFEDQTQLFTQVAFLFLLGCLVVWAFGPGVFSLDYLICRRCKANDLEKGTKI